jgi:hypothetical protein
MFRLDPVTLPSEDKGQRRVLPTIGDVWKNMIIDSREKIDDHFGKYPLT